MEVDVSDVLEAKIEARLAHASQTPSPAGLRRRWRYTARIERFHQVDVR
jgi:LmbE family N-acetylglucosaminyl deacetylase